MPSYPNTGSEGPPLDHEDWTIAFQPYAEFPILAFILAQHLNGLKELIESGQQEASAALDRAIEVLMPHTNFRDAGRTVYLLAVAGNLSTEQEENSVNSGCWSSYGPLQTATETPCRKATPDPPVAWSVTIAIG